MHNGSQEKQLRVESPLSEKHLWTTWFPNATLLHSPGHNMLVQECLMLQSWINVANMHELFTVSSHTQRKSIISLAVCCMSNGSTVRTQQHELWTYYFVDHTPRWKVNSSCSLQWRYSRSAQTLNLPPDYVREQTSSLTLQIYSRLCGLLSRPLKMRGASCHSFENASLALWLPLLVHTAL